MDGIITALLALCAMMVVFSTIVSIMQEAVHKGLQSRRKGMITLMESLYIRSIAPRLRNENLLIAREHSDKAGARQFALDMTANSTLLQSPQWRKISETPVLRLYFGGRIERLSTSEFAEQLARSEVGKIICRQDDAALKETIRGFAFDFERFGDAQLATFKKKAKVSAVLIGAIVAIALNVDVLHVFRSLVADPDRAVAVASSVNTAPAGSAGQSLAESGQSVQAAAAGFEDLGLPIGARFFPYCQQAPGAAGVIDPRCGNGGPAGVKLMFAKSGVTYDESQVQNLWARMRGDDGYGLIWLVSILFAGAAFGMGAPFWFNLFRKLGATSAGGKVVSIAGLDTTQQPGTAAFQPLTIRSEAATPDTLLHAFRTVMAGEC